VALRPRLSPGVPLSRCAETVHRVSLEQLVDLQDPVGMDSAVGVLGAGQIGIMILASATITLLEQLSIDVIHVSHPLKHPAETIVDSLPYRRIRVNLSGGRVETQGGILDRSP
jgi:hypothetical protein